MARRGRRGPQRRQVREAAELILLNEQAAIPAARVPRPNVRLSDNPDVDSATGFSKNQLGPGYVPDMPAQSDIRPDLVEYGGTGTAIFNGIITGEDYNPDFYWRQATKIFDTMRRNDAQVQAVMMMMELPVRRAASSSKKIVPFDDSPEAIDIASFVETALFHKMEQSFDDILRQILLMLTFGFFVFEPVYKIENGSVLWQKWAPRLPRTIYRWWIGPDNDLEGIQQWTFTNYAYRYLNIPAEKLLVFTYRKEGNNFEGFSPLRAAYKHWYMKDKLYTIEAIGIERAHVPIPVIRMPENYSDKDLAAAQNMGANIRANELLYMTLPAGWDVEWMASKGRPLSVEIQPAILHHNMMIATSILAGFLNLGESATGAYSLATPLIELFLLALQGVVENIEDTINLNAIPRLVDYNFTTDKYPRISLGEVSIKGIEDLADSLSKLGKSGFITPTEEIQDQLLKMAGIPRAPKNQVEATNMVADPSNSAKVLPAPGADQRTVSGNATEAGIVSE